MKSWISLRFFYFVWAIGTASTAACGGRIGGGGAPQAMAEAPPPAKAGAQPLRRLTAEQYRHTVLDLVGVRADDIELPIDEGTAGFFANTLAPVSELQLEQYARAAELVARTAEKQLPALVTATVGCSASEAGAAACAQRFIDSFGRRAYRRPLTGEERAAMNALFARGHTAGGPAAGLKLVVQALFASPHFLYLVEPLPVGPTPVAPVPPYALAARLAYFLWASTPDEALLAAAENGKLTTRAGIAEETVRLMQDARFSRTLASFHLQWLDLTELAGVEKRNKLYPLFTPALRKAMREETVRFVDEVVRRDDGRLATLLTGRFSMVGEGLYELYGLGKKTGDEAAWRRVDLGAHHRSGLLSQASFLTRHAHWDKPSLVLRGKVIRERLLCTDLPPPPPDVNNTPPPFDPKVSMRERFEDHRSEVSCSRCHRLIDPLGIPFENYDGIGAWRTMDGPAPVDPTSELSGTAKSDGDVKNAVELVERLAGSDEVRDCLVLQWFRYALGRDAGPADADSLGQLRRVFREAGGQVPTLVAAIPTVDAFRYVEASK